MFYIYALLDPNTKGIRYIGKSIDYLERYKEHLLPSNLKKPTHKVLWIKSLLNQNLKPDVIIIDTAASHEEANEKEISFIAHYKNLGIKLTNATLGGDGKFGVAIPEETKLKISQSMKGKNTKPEIKSNCLHCQKEFTFKAKYLKRGHKFCSLSCAVRHNNSLRNTIPV